MTTNYERAEAIDALYKSTSCDNPECVGCNRRRDEIEDMLEAHAEEAAHAAAEAILAGVRKVREILIGICADEDLSDDKFREHSESTIPQAHDILLKLECADSAAWLLRHDAQVALEEHKKTCRELVYADSLIAGKSHPCGCTCGCHSKCPRRIELES